MASRRSGLDEDVLSVIEEELQVGNVVGEMKFISGSSWSSCYKCETSTGIQLFIKMARGKSAKDMFEGEALGLKAMYDTHAMKIPNVLRYGDAASGGGSYIIMEYLNFGGRCPSERLGECLAKMHLSHPVEEKALEGMFGFPIDNTIGGTPQPNPWTSSWVDFFREHRLRHQLRLANDPTLTKLGDKLCSNLDSFFDGIEVRPCILHGDLWSGNIASVAGEPSLFDPACYYGHHEAEFGMSWCAGFDNSFWSTYHSIIPKEPGFNDRHDIYTLYHYLNHYNLFGGGYYNQCVSLLRRLT